MGFCLLLIIALMLYNARFSSGLFCDYLSKNKTDAIKGIFIIIVFTSHIKEYYVQAGADLTAWYDNAFFLPAKALGQLMVVMFLFYSGYGVAESIKKKGEAYIRKIPKRRVLGTLANFDVAVVVFAVASLLLGKTIGTEQFLLSLVGWSDVGNSNWYIFCIIVCYALTYISYRLNSKPGGRILFLLLIVYAITMSFFKGTWWYNIVFAYGAGILFSEHKESILVRFTQQYTKCLILTGSGFVTCLICYLTFYGAFKTNMEVAGAFVFNVMSVFFALLVVIITMKVSFQNKALVWLGTNLFPLYIYQRLPMMVLTTLYPATLVAAHPYVFLLLCVATTGGIAWGYKFIKVKL